MEENHCKISKELDSIRFSKHIMKKSTSNHVQKQPIQTTNVETDLQFNETNMKVIDFSQLPQELFTQIEDFIKKEIPEAVEFDEDDPNDIIEVPVPPKPIPELVTLEEEDLEIQLNPDSNNPYPDSSSTTVNLDSNNVINPLENNSENNTNPDSNNSVRDEAKWNRLKVLAEEESSLFNELRRIEEKKSEFMSRLEHLRELRTKILFE